MRCQRIVEDSVLQRFEQTHGTALDEGERATTTLNAAACSKPETSARQRDLNRPASRNALCSRSISA
jgi:hypothetical protein